jgi:6-phosphogluconolactonase (cycloisomerase 2 family)
VEDMESDVRFKSIVVLSTEPHTLYWKKESKDKVDVGSFEFDDKTHFTGVDKSSIPKGCYIAIYCITHEYLYALYPCKGG